MGQKTNPYALAYSLTKGDHHMNGEMSQVGIEPTSHGLKVRYATVALLTHIVHL